MSSLRRRQPRCYPWRHRDALDPEICGTRSRETIIVRGLFRSEHFPFETTFHSARQQQQKVTFSLRAGQQTRMGMSSNEKVCPLSRAIKWCDVSGFQQKKVTMAELSRSFEWCDGGGKSKQFGLADRLDFEDHVGYTKDMGELQEEMLASLWKITYSEWAMPYQIQLDSVHGASFLSIGELRKCINDTFLVSSSRRNVE
ncbi:hypothetical protein CEXT_8541 [Caerostris extrusa]|uniref:Uncharacterized protein n=1 Tax=Caerostris extrusa TaxID=172846 RepID=A0AAV4PSI7_CAEEX|nr:hypothetical protein CEXT_8541 [Caerostris extrusa]